MSGILLMMDTQLTLENQQIIASTASTNTYIIAGTIMYIHVYSVNIMQSDNWYWTKAMSFS